uniref:Cocaine- and amphetamine-regulated transcript protein n=1 Tax=Echeneis naucrates TaxID=173247 RepID=A0A665TJV3_ECHNA
MGLRLTFSSSFLNLIIILNSHWFLGSGLFIGLVLSQVDESVKTRNDLSRLPGLCPRLKRRRVTVLCNLEKFCWKGRSQKNWSGQVCRCPRGSKCSRFFVHSL